MAPAPLSRSEFLKLMALGGAGLVALGAGACGRAAPKTGATWSPSAAAVESSPSAAGSPHTALDKAALDGDADAAAGGHTVLAVARGGSAESNVKRVLAAVGGMRKFLYARAPRSSSNPTWSGRWRHSTP